MSHHQNGGQKLTKNISPVVRAKGKPSTSMEAKLPERIVEEVEVTALEEDTTKGHCLDEGGRQIDASSQKAEISNNEENIKVTITWKIIQLI